MNRRAFPILSLASAVVFVVLLGWWVRGMLGDDVWVRCVGSSVLVYGADSWASHSAHENYFEPAGEKNGFTGARALLGRLQGTPAPPGSFKFAGVEVYWDHTIRPQAYRAVVIPIVYPLLLAAVLPAAWAVRRLGNRASAVAGRCVCGYDLRATPGRCPECGRTPAGAAA